MNQGELFHAQQYPADRISHWRRQRPANFQQKVAAVLDCFTGPAELMPRPSGRAIGRRGLPGPSGSKTKAGRFAAQFRQDLGSKSQETGN